MPSKARLLIGAIPSGGSYSVHQPLWALARCGSHAISPGNSIMVNKEDIEGIVSWAMRGIIIAAITLAGWTANRLVQTLDSQGKSVEEIHSLTTQNTSDLRNLQTTIDSGRRARDSQFLDLKTTLADHEGRIRSLERPRINP